MILWIGFVVLLFQMVFAGVTHVATIILELGRDWIILKNLTYAVASLRRREWPDCQSFYFSFFPSSSSCIPFPLPHPSYPYPSLSLAVIIQLYATLCSSMLHCIEAGSDKYRGCISTEVKHHLFCHILLVTEPIQIQWGGGTNSVF